MKTAHPFSVIIFVVCVSFYVLALAIWFSLFEAIVITLTLAMIPLSLLGIITLIYIWAVKKNMIKGVSYSNFTMKPFGPTTQFVVERHLKDDELPNLVKAANRIIKWTGMR